MKTAAVSFESTISLGTILTALTLLIAGIGAHWRQSSRIDILSVKQELIGETLKTLTELLQTTARQDERILSVQRQIEELRHGRGYIQNRDIGIDYSGSK